jgi:hypothetical protein
MPTPGRATDKGVFINCPFDLEYKEHLNVLLFTVCDCGFSPRIALESADSGELRFSKILRLIKQCRYAIHDISRVGIDPKTQLPRYNMVLELGVFLGARMSRSKKPKVCLVMDSDLRRYRDFCSDLAGVDINAHSGDRLQLACVVRDWLDGYREDYRIIPSGGRIFERYQKFVAGLPRRCEHFKLDPTSLTFSNYMSLLEAWLRENDWRVPESENV